MIHALRAVPAAPLAGEAASRAVSLPVPGPGLGIWLNAVRTALTAPIVLRYFL